MGDIRYTFRQLARQQGWSVVAGLTLALGIGAATAILSIIDAAMLRPLPYPHPEQLVTIGVETVRPDGKASRRFPSMDDMRLWQQSGDVLSAAAGFRSASGFGLVVDGPEPERIEVLEFTEAYLSMHGVAPLFGRDLTIADMDAAAPNVALLGYGYWQRRFGGRRDVIGEILRLEGGSATIVGVLPSSFNAEVPVSRPLRISAVDAGRPGTLLVHARLQPGVTIEQATERLSTRMAAVGGAGSARSARARVRSRLAAESSHYRTTANILAGAAGLILLIACVNVAGLLLARGSARETELAVRSALGAGRSRLIRQLLTESAILALIGGAMGIILAWWSLDTIVANLPLSLPANSPATLNRHILLATVVLLVPTALIFGLLPAFRLSRMRVGSGGGGHSRTALSRRGAQLLIGAEVALAVILVTGAGLMLRSYARLTAVDLGFKPDGLLMMELLPLDKNPAVHGAYYRDLLPRLRSLPGVQSVGLVDYFALGAGMSMTQVRGSGDFLQATVFEVLPGYFETIGVTLREGRLPADVDDARGVVINESAARALFPDGAAAGRSLIRAGRDAGAWTVLGVIADIRHSGPRGWIRPQVFFPLAPTEAHLSRAMMVVLRASGPMSELASRARQTAHSIGPRVLVQRVRTAGDLLADHVVTPRRRATLLGLLGGVGLALAIVGVFGLTGYAVSRRTREFGLRIALGARPDQVVRTVMKDSLLPIVVGTIVGLGAAALATRVVESFLFETARTDPGTFAGVALTLAITGCLAALVPALRAARVDPMITLRAE